MKALILALLFSSSIYAKDQVVCTDSDVPRIKDVKNAFQMLTRNGGMRNTQAFGLYMNPDTKGFPISYMGDFQVLVTLVTKHDYDVYDEKGKKVDYKIDHKTPSATTVRQYFFKSAHEYTFKAKGGPKTCAIGAIALIHPKR